MPPPPLALSPHRRRRFGPIALVLCVQRTAGAFAPVNLAPLGRRPWAAAPRPCPGPRHGTSAASSAAASSSDEVALHHHENDFDVNKYDSIESFNNKLETLAKRCLDEVPGKKEDAIGTAALAEGMLHRLEHMVKDDDGAGDAIIRPNCDTYNNVIFAWSKACAALAEGRGRGTLETTIGTNMMELNVYTAQDAASRALSILSEVENNYLTGKSDIRPDLDAYNAVMDAWAKSRVKEATDNVEQLLKRMVHLSKGGEEGKDEAVNGSREQWETISPNIASFNSAIEAWSYSAKTGASEKAIDILDMLEREYSATGNEKIKPTIRTVNQVINALAKNIAIEQGNLNRRDDAWAAAEKSRELLEKMKTRYDETGDSDYKPDPVTYTTCVDAYARVGHRKAAEAAEKLLEEMINTEGIFPNYRTFTAAITAWSKAPDPYRAEKLLTRMESMYENELASGRKTRRANSLKPNSRTYTAVVTALSRSRDAQKAQKSLKLLKKMLDMHRGGNEGMKPSQFTYNAVIEACARTKGTGDQQVKALKIAFAVRKAMSAAEGVDPNCITYISLLKCVQNLMPRSEERNSVAKAVFLDARQASVVNSRVLREFQMASDRHVFDELAAECLDKQGNVNADQIPSEWSKKAQ